MNSYFSGITNKLRTIRNNSVKWFIIFMLLFAGIIGRLAYLQYHQYKFWSEKADDLHIRQEIIRAERGRILDRNNEVIAFDDLRYTIFVDPTMIRYPRFIANQLAPVLEMPANQLYKLMTESSSYATISPGVEENKAKAIESLNYPGIKVRAAGYRYILAINIELIPRNSDIIPQLSEALEIPSSNLNRSLGDLMQTLTVDTPKTGVRYLPNEFIDRQKAAVEKLNFPGISFINESTNYQVGVDPRIYLKGNSPLPATEVADNLSPLLDMPAEKIIKKLTFRSKYVELKRDLTMDMQQTIADMQSTLFLAEPAVLNDNNIASKKQTTRLSEAVERLYRLLNGEKGKKSRKEIISEAELRQILLTRQEPGAIIQKTVESTNGKNGKPDKRIGYSLYDKPILGISYGLFGIGLKKEPRRFYPYKNMASASLGYLNNSHGAFGLEATKDKHLSGVDGMEEKEIDNWNRSLPDSSKRVEPINGLDIKLTIDIAIQQAAEEELEKQVKAQRALQGQCVVLDVKTGEILALATAPSWDANHPGNSKIPLMNTVINNYYEPGSTFKAATVAAALEDGVINDGALVTNCIGRMSIGKKTISEAHGHKHGAVTCETLISKSCNIGAAQLALRLGPDKFLGWMEKFGFGQRTGIEIAHESSGQLNKSNIHSRLTLATMGFGQSLAVTPLQMAAFYAALANNGEYNPPHLIKSELLSDRVNWLDIKVPARNICSPDTGKLLLRYLEKTVTEGTGKNIAEIPGYRVGGKTGTAQKAMPGVGVKSGKYIASFIGVAPIDNPRLVIIAIIDEPKGSIYGGTTAGPVFQKVGERALRYLNVPPSNTLAD